MTRLDYQPLFGKGARVPPPEAMVGRVRILLLVLAPHITARRFLSSINY